MRACTRVCLPRESLLCVVRHVEPPVLVLSDSEHASAQLVAVLRLAGVSAVHDEDALGLSAVRPQCALAERRAQGAPALDGVCARAAALRLGSLYAF